SVVVAAEDVAELAFPVGRRTELLPAAVASQLVVRAALVLVAQRLVGFGHLLEAFLRVLFLRNVGVVFARELAIRLFDVRLGGVARDSERLVVVLVLHPLRLIALRLRARAGIRPSARACPDRRRRY